jgi:hypothetical protein
MFPRRLRPGVHRGCPIRLPRDVTAEAPEALAAGLLCRHRGNGYAAGRSSRQNSSDADEHVMAEGSPRGSTRNELDEAIARVERQLALLRSAIAARVAAGRPQQGLHTLVGSTEDRLAVLKAQRRRALGKP